MTKQPAAAQKKTELLKKLIATAPELQLPVCIQPLVLLKASVNRYAIFDTLLLTSMTTKQAAIPTISHNSAYFATLFHAKMQDYSEIDGGGILPTVRRNE